MCCRCGSSCFLALLSGGPFVMRLTSSWWWKHLRESGSPHLTFHSQFIITLASPLIGCKLKQYIFTKQSVKHFSLTMLNCHLIFWFSQDKTGLNQLFYSKLKVQDSMLSIVAIVWVLQASRTSLPTQSYSIAFCTTNKWGENILKIKNDNT